jgi:hypothetical protein
MSDDFASLPLGDPDSKPSRPSRKLTRSNYECNLYNFEMGKISSSKLQKGGTMVQNYMKVSIYTGLTDQKQGPGKTAFGSKA